MQPHMEISYEDFEPFCKWKRDQNSDTLEVHLPGFKRQQLRVLINSSGVLSITGERQSDEDKMKKSQFRKEFPVSENYQTNQIQAKFSSGVLYLVMPKDISTISGAARNNIATPGTFLVSVMNRNKRMALEIIVAISMAVAVGAYVKKYCQCSHLWN
ncbi:hypothetical protein PTKIN_Ptkin06aG0153000 [Pterospermum kingtungense]